MGKGLEAAFLKARRAAQRGDTGEAARIYRSILQQFPANARARDALARLDGTAAAPATKRSDPPRAAFEMVRALYAQGRHEEALTQAQALAAAYPASPQPFRLLGAAQIALGRHAEAERAFRQALALEPGHVEEIANIVVALRGQGRLDEAVDLCRELLRQRPDNAGAQATLAAMLQALARTDEAIEAWRRAIAIRPDHADARLNLGALLRQAGRPDEALTSLEAALALRPGHAPTLANLGNVLRDLGRTDETIDKWHQALAADPGLVEVHANFVTLFRQLGRTEEMIDACLKVVELRPERVDMLHSVATAYYRQGKLDLAVDYCDRVLERHPDGGAILALKLHLQARMCDWTGFDRFRAVADRLGIDGEIVSPFRTLSYEDDPARQLRRSERWAERSYRRPPAPLPARARPADAPLRIGYFSADFHGHATMYLMAGLFREHDRERFEIYIYSYGATAGGPYRDRLIADVDRFVDIHAMSDDAAIELARADDLDIAVDLKGYTAETRSGLFAGRLAPVQIAHVGYPGSLGADFIDYLVADPVLIPDAERSHYREKILYLPHSYQPNDNQRPIAPTTPTRAEEGLPDQGFVFCSFNQSYKIGPAEFDIWMRLLDRIEGSVLWLLDSNRWSVDNLRAEARRRGIDPDRLRFAKTLPQAEHLARLRLADLFLDSFNVNAHTTASDALWAGLPVVTLAGRQFAARVAASLLHSVGLPDLVTDRRDAYEALAFALATDRERLAGIRARLAESRLRAPLFDTVAYTRHLEAGYAEAVRRHRAGEPPADIRVTG